VLEEELPLELLELLLELELSPGIGGAEPGNGYLSAADGALAGASCFSGAFGADCPCIGAEDSPGNGKRSAAGGVAGGAASQGAVPDLPFDPLLPA
jgi:hypothetical protein